MPLNNYHRMFSLQRITSSSSLRLKLFLRYSRLTMRRMGSLGRPALLRPPPSTHHRLGGAKQVLILEHLADSALMLKLRRYCGLHLTPWQTRSQQRQRIAQIDHGTNSAAEKVHWLHLSIPQKVTLNTTLFGGIGASKLQKKPAFMQDRGVLRGRLNRAPYLVYKCRRELTIQLFWPR